MCIVSNSLLLFRQCHCVVQMETYSRVYEEMYFAILISTLSHMHLKLLHLCWETLRRNVVYDILTPQHTIFVIQPVRSQDDRLILLSTIWSWGTKGLVSAPLSMCQSTGWRTTEDVVLEEAGNSFQAERRELDFSQLCTLWGRIQPCAGLPPESSWISTHTSLILPEHRSLQKARGLENQSLWCQTTTTFGSFLYYLVCLISHQGFSTFFSLMMVRNSNELVPHLCTCIPAVISCPSFLVPFPSG